MNTLLYTSQLSDSREIIVSQFLICSGDVIQQIITYTPPPPLDTVRLLYCEFHSSLEHQNI
jgi:hypothetical protein